MKIFFRFARVGALTLTALFVNLFLGATVSAQAVSVQVAPICPMDYKFEAGKCVKKNPPLSCPSGYSLSGERCTITTSTATRAICPEGMGLRGNGPNCETFHINKRTWGPPSKPATCPAGAVFERGQCVGRTVKSVAATPNKAISIANPSCPKGFTFYAGVCGKTPSADPKPGPVSPVSPVGPVAKQPKPDPFKPVPGPPLAKPAPAPNPYVAKPAPAPGPPLAKPAPAPDPYVAKPAPAPGRGSTIEPPYVCPPGYRLNGKSCNMDAVTATPAICPKGMGLRGNGPNCETFDINKRTWGPPSTPATCRAGAVFERGQCVVRTVKSVPAQVSGNGRY